MDIQPKWIEPVLERLDRLEGMVGELLRQRAVKQWFSPAEAAKLLGKAEFTVREWCRHGRVNFRKRKNGRGKYQAWVISREEVGRIEREGLLPLPATSSRIE